jgi:hypothetical protein
MSKSKAQISEEMRIYFWHFDLELCLKFEFLPLNLCFLFYAKNLFFARKIAARNAEGLGHAAVWR